MPCYLHLLTPRPALPQLALWSSHHLATPAPAPTPTAPKSQSHLHLHLHLHRQQAITSHPLLPTDYISQLLPLQPTGTHQQLPPTSLSGQTLVPTPNLLHLRPSRQNPTNRRRSCQRSLPPRISRITAPHPRVPQLGTRPGRQALPGLTRGAHIRLYLLVQSSPTHLAISHLSDRRSRRQRR